LFFGSSAVLNIPFAYGVLLIVTVRKPFIRVCDFVISFRMI